MKYCKKCAMPDTRPGSIFDAEGVCQACRNYEKRETVSHYAINPNCEPNSPDDVVLLFDTKGGWNQSGGFELLAPENHKDKGCNILFNDGTVKFVKKKNFDRLRWK